MTRPSKRELERELEELGGADLKPLTLAEALSYETERINEEVVRVVETGDLRRSRTDSDSSESGTL